MATGERIRWPAGPREVYEGWHDHQVRLVAAIQPLSDAQVQLRPSPDHWAVWQLASNIAGGRAHWFHEVLHEGDASIRDMLRVAATTVPGLPLEDAGWEDDEDHPRGAAELVLALERTWLLVESCVRRWTADDLAVEFVRERWGRRQSVSRGWVVWHVIEHDLEHGTELALILRAHGLPTLEI
jgi:uncharacterized damage-inducible protein DinB